MAAALYGARPGARIRPEFTSGRRRAVRDSVRWRTTNLRISACLTDASPGSDVEKVNPLLDAVIRMMTPGRPFARSMGEVG